MFKVIITSIMLLVPSMSLAAPKLTCGQQSDLIKMTAMVRDSGGTASEAIGAMVSAGLDASIAIAISVIAFEAGKDLTPTELRKAYYIYCISEGA